MERITVEELVDWTESEYGGIIVNFSPEAFKTVSYFLREFALPTTDPFDQIGAFRSGRYLVVGTRYFRDDVCKVFNLSRQI
jgi:hypothetical protein